MDIEQEIKCTNCNTVYDKDDLGRYCSNCFACTGCIKYVCDSCGELIEIKPVRDIKKESKF